VKTCGPTADAHPKHRYTAVTVTTDVYDVLKTRTSEKKGATGRANDAATGNVTVSPRSGPAPANKRNNAARGRVLLQAFRIPSGVITGIRHDQSMSPIRALFRLHLLLNHDPAHRAL
jgi:hypothetical protein